MIIATSGCGNNKELLKSIAPFIGRARDLGMPLLTGDGLIDRNGSQRHHRRCPLAPSGRRTACLDVVLNIVGEGGESIEIAVRRACLGTDLAFVEQNGEQVRITEDNTAILMAAIQLLSNQQSPPSFLSIFRQISISHAAAHGIPQQNLPRAWQLVFQNLHEELICQAETGRMKISESLKEIRIGSVPTRQILRAATTNDAACDEGHDGVVGQNPRASSLCARHLFAH